jgi:hypothetical protein
VTCFPTCPHSQGEPVQFCPWLGLAANPGDVSPVAREVMDRCIRIVANVNVCKQPRLNRIQLWCPGPEVRTIAQQAVCELRVPRDTRVMSLLVLLWLGSSLPSRPRIQANFRTATPARPLHGQPVCRAPGLIRSEAQLTSKYCNQSQVAKLLRVHSSTATTTLHSRRPWASHQPADEAARQVGFASGQEAAEVPRPRSGLATDAVRRAAQDKTEFDDCWITPRAKAAAMQ